MDATQKLDRFMDEVKAGTDAQIAADLEEAQQEAAQIVSEAEARCRADAERTVTAAKAKVTAKYQKRISQVGYRGKTALLSRRQSLLMQLFSDLRAKLAAFTGTEDYAAWMAKLVQNYAAAHGQDENPVFLLRAQDLQMQEQLSAVFGRACSFRQDDSILLGGLSAVSADGRRCENHTLDEALQSQLRNFYRSHKIGEETGGET